jgi:hypothetical protein
MRIAATGLGLMGMALLTGCWKGPGPAVEPTVATVAVVPARAVLTVGRAAAFGASMDGVAAREVTWRVLEPGGGTVAADGRYQAPAAPGVFTVQARFTVTGQTAAAKVTVVAPPAGTISAPARVLPGAEGLKAGIAPVAGSSYLWSVTGGEVTAGVTSPAVTFRAGTGSKLELKCRVTNQAGDTLNSSLEVPVVAPVTLAISPAAVTLTAGRAMKFGFNIAGGITLGVAWSLGEPGAGSLDQAGHYVAPEVPGRYTVRVASLDDPTRVAVAKVQVVARPPESLFAPASFLPQAHGLRASVPDVPGMTYAWSIEGGTITAGADRPVLVFDAGAGPDLVLRCKVTNAAGDSSVATQTLKAL